MNPKTRDRLREQAKDKAAAYQTLTRYDVLLQYVASMRNALRNQSQVSVVLSNPGYWPGDGTEIHEKQPFAYLDTFSVVRARKNLEHVLDIAVRTGEDNVNAQCIRLRQLEAELCTAAVTAMEDVLRRHKRRIQRAHDQVLEKVVNAQSVKQSKGRQLRRLSLEAQNTQSSVVEGLIDGDPDTSE